MTGKLLGRILLEKVQNYNEENMTTDVWPSCKMDFLHFSRFLMNAWMQEKFTESLLSYRNYSMKKWISSN